MAVVPSPLNSGLFLPMAKIAAFASWNARRMAAPTPSWATCFW